MMPVDRPPAGASGGRSEVRKMVERVQGAGERGSRSGSLAPAVAAALAVLAAPPAAAWAAPTPILVGPVTAPAGAADFAAAAYRAAFDESGRTAEVALDLIVTTPGTIPVALGFGGRGLLRLEATVDGAPVRVRPATAPIAAAGGPFDRQVWVEIPAGVASHRVVVSAHVETVLEELGPAMTAPEATFILNRWEDPPVGHAVLLDPADAARGAVTFEVRTPSSSRPDAPVAGTTTDDGEGRVLRGAATGGGPYRIASVAGPEAPPRRWSLGFAVGIGLDWPLTERTVIDRTSRRVVERWYETPGVGDHSPHAWLRLFYQYAVDDLLITTGLEGDPLSILEIPITVSWFPIPPSPSDPRQIGDVRLLGGLAFQVFNGASPGDHGFDPRIFLRVGAGFRLFLWSGEIAYEIAPPMGEWNGPRGLMEHKLTFTCPFAF
jgi:hypothetical protein